MIGAAAPASSASGPQGGKLAAQAERLTSMFWETALSEMMSSVLSSSSLGTGAGSYADLALNALTSAGLFSKEDGGLTNEIVAQLTGPNGSAPAASAELGAKVDSLAHSGPLLSTLDNLRLAGAGAVGGLQIAAGWGGSSAAASVPMLGEAIAYAQSIWPSVEQAAAALNVPPVALLAQSALETGWGASAPGNNVFGVKAVAGQAATTDATTEYQNGKMVAQTASFAAYSSVAQSVQHYVGLIKSGYAAAIGSPSVARYAASLQAGGYATDPDYAQKIISIANSPIMNEILRMLGVDGAAP
jgi:peptidoglycan hydrolase FlgJ